MTDDDDGDLGPSVEEFFKMMYGGGVYGAPSIEDEPTVALIYWRVFKTNWADGRVTLHLNGIVNGSLGGRMSSPIIHYNPEEKIVETRSGRLYRLVGEPAVHAWAADAEYIREVWMRRNGLEPADAVDVTLAYLSAMNGEDG